MRFFRTAASAPPRWQVAEFDQARIKPEYLRWVQEERGAMCSFRLLALECAVAHVRGKIGFVEENVFQRESCRAMATWRR